MSIILGRAEAVDAIASAIADRDAFVIIVPPTLVTALAAPLGDVPAWTAYVDNGTPMVLTTTDAAALSIVDLLGVPAAAVVTVPKTVPATVLTQAIGQEVPADGSQDIVLLADPETGFMVWPVLFLDALAKVDPKAAAAIRATDLTAQS